MAYVLIVHGADEYQRSTWIRESIKERSETESPEIVRLDGSRIGPEELSVEVGGVPLLSSRRIVRIDRGGKMGAPVRRILVEYAKQGGEPVVLLDAEEGTPAKELRQVAEEVVEIGRLRASDASRFVREQLRKEDGRDLTPGAARMLVVQTGPNPGALAAEVLKIARMSEGSPIGEEQVRELTRYRSRETLWRLADAWSDKDSRRMLEVFRQLKEQGLIRGAGALTPLHLTALDLASAKAGRVKGPKWKQRKMKGAAAKWQWGEIDEAIRALTEADEGMKMGEDAERTFREFLIHQIRSTTPT